MPYQQRGERHNSRRAGDYGPDRIARNSYDLAGQLRKTTVAYGTADQADERTMTYGATGQILTLADGESNLTSYDYDGQDRLLATRFPVRLVDVRGKRAVRLDQIKLGKPSIGSVTSAPSQITLYTNNDGHIYAATDHATVISVHLPILGDKELMRQDPGTFRLREE